MLSYNGKVSRSDWDQGGCLSKSGKGEIKLNIELLLEKAKLLLGIIEKE